MKYNAKNLIFISGLTSMLLFGSLNSVVALAADMGKYADGAMVKKHWGYESINYLMDKGALNGIKQGDKTYISPNNIITRAEYLKILWDVVDPGFKVYKEKNTDPDTGFSETRYEGFPSWYSEYAIKTLNSIPSNKVEPTAEWFGKPINREEVAYFTGRLLYTMGNPNFNDQDFSLGDMDSSIEPWIENSIKDANYKPSKEVLQLYRLGILSGDDKGNFRPSNNLTRAEAASILHRVIVPSKRVEVKPIYDTAEDRYDYTIGENATLRQDDPYRRSVKEGDTFIDLNGKAWKVKLNPITNTYNPEDPVAFDEGRETSIGQINRVGGGTDGTAGGKFGDTLRIAKNGHINWQSEFEKIEASGFDKPNKIGTKDGELSTHKYYYWDADEQEWVFSLGKMETNMKTYNIK